MGKKAVLKKKHKWENLSAYLKNTHTPDISNTSTDFIPLRRLPFISVRN